MSARTVTSAEPGSRLVGPDQRTQALLLLLFGGALVRLGTSSLFPRYVRSSARPWVLVAGLALLAVAALRLTEPRRRSGTELPAGRRGWLLLAPVVAVLVVSPPALGAYSATRSPVAVPATGHRSFPPLTGSAPHALQLLDFTTRALWDAGRTLTGQDVTLTGFVLTREPGGFVIARLVITCCAADARPVEVVIDSDRTPQTSSWVQVTGRYAGASHDPPQVRSQQSGVTPVLRATTLNGVVEPTNPYD